MSAEAVERRFMNDTLLFLILILFGSPHPPALGLLLNGAADIEREGIFIDKGQYLLEKHLRHLTERIVVTQNVDEKIKLVLGRRIVAGRIELIQIAVQRVAERHSGSPAYNAGQLRRRYTTG